MSIDDKSEASSEGGSSSRSSCSTTSSSRRRSNSFSYRNSFAADELAWLGIAGVPNVRSRVGLYIKDGSRLRNDFHALFRVLEDKKKADGKKKSRKHEVQNDRNRRRKAGENNPGLLVNNSSNVLSKNISDAPCIQIDCNPSCFGTYAHVRSVVLQDAAKQAQSIYLSSSNPSTLSDSESEDESHQTSKDSPVNLPKMVGIGIVSVYELISGSVSAYPALCIRALEALLDILQGQHPEALKNEPAPVIESLFQLLLRLSTSNGSTAGDMLNWPTASPLTGVACACLLALVVARGDSAMYLRAVTDILITSRHLATQTIQVPVILTYLQRSVHALLLGKLSRPDWFTTGVPNSACIDTFPVNMMTDGSGDCSTAMTCDGHYLYLHNSHGMFKVGTGFGGTRKGHIYMHRPDCFPKQTGWLGFANGDVYYRPDGTSRDLMMLDKETLKISEVHQTFGVGWNRGAPFSDGQYIGYILPDREDGFMVHSFNPLVKPIPLVNELNLSLAVRCVQVFGNGEGVRELGSGMDDEVFCVAAGKDFTIMCNNSGKLFYSGKASAVGMKGGASIVGSLSSASVGVSNSAHQAQPEANILTDTFVNTGTLLPPTNMPKRLQPPEKVKKWPELVVNKWPNIVSVSVGHEGHHAVLLSDDGAAFFVGTARRGEDAESGKVRRQPKASKPKRMSKIEGHFIVSSACNYATSALVSKEGELFLFGKDTAHADSYSGVVNDLRDAHIRSVALGKAHAVVVSNKGVVYSFGINNKGQCGRDFNTVTCKEPSAAMSNEVSSEEENKKDSADAANKYKKQSKFKPSKDEKPREIKLKEDEGISSMAIAADDEFDEDECLSEEGEAPIASGNQPPVAGNTVMCSFNSHRFYRDHCMVCLFCQECTGYGPSCVSSHRPNRVAGEACGCGSGESGCSECGCCRSCALDGAADVAEQVEGEEDEGNRPASAAPDFNIGEAARDMIFTKACGKLQQELQRRMGDPKFRQTYRSPKEARQKHSKSKKRESEPIVFSSPSVSQEPRGSEVTPDREAGGKMASLPPAQVVIPSPSPVVEVTCGQHHTVVLCSNGEVYSWGSNTYGQLGTGDLVSHPTPQLIRLPPPIRVGKVAAGSNHTVLLTTSGQIYTCGSYQKGQLGRIPTSAEMGEGTSNRAGPRTPWWSFPGLVPGIGPRLGRKATWIGASADTTFIKLDQSLINSHNLSSAAVVANSSSLVLFPVGERCKDPSSLVPAPSSSSSSSPSHSSSSARARCSSFSSSQSSRFRTTDNGVVEERSSSFSGSIKRSGFVDTLGSTLSGAFGGGSIIGIGSSGSLCKAGSSSNSSLAAIAGSGADSNSSIGNSSVQIDAAKGSAEDCEESWRVLVINRADGQCRSFSSTDQILCRGNAICLDAIYNILWSFDPERQTIRCYNLIACEAVRLNTAVGNSESPAVGVRTSAKQSPTSFSDDSGLRDILSPELSLPVLPEVQVSRAQIALHLLSCLDTLTWGYQQGLSITEEEPQVCHNTRMYSKEDFTPVSRFDSHGGGWGYSGHSVEAVRFMCDTDVLIGGFGLFGGRGEYMGKIKLYDIGFEGGEQEQEGDILAETEEIPYECASRQKFPIMFDEPVQLHSRRWYVAWARVTGPSSDCGSSGQSMVATEDQVIFYFKSSKKSNNGTDINAGQIPQLLYRILSSESGNVPSTSSTSDSPIPLLSKTFFTSVSNDVFQSLLDLLGWAWSTLRSCVNEASNNACDGVNNLDSTTKIAMMDLHRLVYICRACLRLLNLYVNQLYPNSAKNSSTSFNINEKNNLVESVSDVRSLLRQMLSDSLPSSYQHIRRSKKLKHKIERNPLTRLVVSVLEECHRTFVLCFHAFYPTGALKWACLCDLLVSRDSQSDEASESDRLLSAVLAALSSPNVRLRTTFPMLGDHESSESYTRPSPADSAILSTLQPGDMKYPLLVEHMTYKAQTSGTGSFGCVWTFREVLERLLGVICSGVRGALRGDRLPPLPSLIHNTCLLIAAAVAELVSETTQVDCDTSGTGGRVLFSTPCRFSKTTQNRSWSTGNGSPDAICFSVDKSGIMLAGISVYVGSGNYDYELELLDEMSANVGSDPTIPPGIVGSGLSDRWGVFESVRGSLSPDDYLNDMCQIKFDKPVAIKEGTKYAIRLVNRGARTTNGDQGQSSVKGHDGTNFTFSACSLSVNGTNHIRGQIPQLLYYNNETNVSSDVTLAVGAQQARSAVLSVVGSVIRSAADLCIMGLGVGDDSAIRVLEASPIVTTLLPLLLAHVSPVALSDPRSAVSVLGLCQELIPHVAALNNLSLVTQNDAIQGCHSTTSQHYATVESEHPYKPATINCYRVRFPASVQWMTLEFDPQSSLAQPEDIIVVLIPNTNKASSKNSLPNSPSSIINNNSTTTYTKKKDVSKSRKKANAAVDVDRRKEDKGNKKGGLMVIEPPISIPLDNDSPASEELPYWPVLPRINSVNKFPERTVIIPGNELVISMETASDYLKEERGGGAQPSSKYGFSAHVVGFEWPPVHCDSIRHLEKELSYLGGLCAASLIKKDLKLPPVGGEEFDEDLEGSEESSMAIVKSHPALLSKGFALSNPPTIHHALDGIIPFSCHSNERLFLRDYVSCSEGTSGGRLARWLQPDSYVDVKNAEVICAKEELRAGWPAIVTIVTRDQYNEVVSVPHLKIEVVSVPVSESGQKCKVPRRLSQNCADNMTFGGHPQPSINTPYSVTIREKMCYCAITMMKAYEKYSFEELRYVSPALQRPTEHMLVRANADGTYTCNWTPGASGCYSLHITIDGYTLEKTHKLTVKEPPQGLAPPVSSCSKKQSEAPSKFRRFAVQHSAGLRVRSHTSLQSEMIGLVKTNSVISFVDEVHNSDGVWLRLSGDSVTKYCSHLGSNKTQYTEAWVLQYHQHLGKTLLVPHDETKALKQKLSTSKSRDSVGFDREIGGVTASTPLFSPDPSTEGGNRVEAYSVVKCGASGHNIRTQASLRAPPIGMLVSGNIITTDCQINNSEGSWVRLDLASTRKYCFIDGEAWSLAESKGHTLFLQWRGPVSQQQAQQMREMSTSMTAFDFSASEKPLPTFVSETETPFVFGTCEEEAGGDTTPSREIKDGMGSSKFSAMNKWLKDEANKQPSPPSIATPVLSVDVSEEATATVREDIPQELQGVSVRELVKAIGESRANGNGSTPPRTPPPTPRKVARSRSSSPRVISSSGASSLAPPLAAMHNSHSPPNGMASDSAPSPIPEGEILRCRSSDSSFLVNVDTTAAQCGSVAPTDTDTSEMVSPLTQDMSHSAASGGSSLATTSTPTTPRKEPSGSQRVLSSEALKFSLGSGGTTDEVRLSPKGIRKGIKTNRNKRERLTSPGYTQDKPKEKVKEAMSPSVAECMRAVFAAFLWHEGIVHDAMACASFLKFNPDLTKQSAYQCKHEMRETLKTEGKLTKEQKARQRHSVEVSAYSYLNVTPQNTDEFIRPGTKGTTNMNEISRANDMLETEKKKEEELFGGYSNNYSALSCSQKLATVMEGSSNAGDLTELPLVLRYVVLLWEELSLSCMKALSQQMVQPPLLGVATKARNKDKLKEKEKKSKHKKKSAAPEEVVDDENSQPQGSDSQFWICELCGILTRPENFLQHVLMFHPGCGSSSHGCGYVLGQWKLFTDHEQLDHPCGTAKSSCYHMCWNCRRSFKNASKSKREGKFKDPGLSKNKRKMATAGKLLSPSSQLESHIIMRNNAMFLLDLASAASPPSPPLKPHKRSPMPGISPGESSVDSSPFPQIAFQCLHTLNCQQQHINQLKEDLLLNQPIEEGSLFGRGGRNLSVTPEKIYETETTAMTVPSPPNGSLHHDSSGSDSDVPRNSRQLNRSVSVTVGAASGQDWSAVLTQENGEVVTPVSPIVCPTIDKAASSTVVLRKRNNSSEHPAAASNNAADRCSVAFGSSSSSGATAHSSSLLAHPSTWLERLASGITQTSSCDSKSNTNISDSYGSTKAHSVITRPVMSFILMHHDLETLAYSMRQATRKASARVYGMQALNWLLRSVTQPTSLHDLLWAFASALKPQECVLGERKHHPSAEEAKMPDHQNNRQADIMDMGENDMVVLDHPLSDVSLAGDAVHPLPITFHLLLQTVADLMMLLPPGEPLQMMAVRCFGLRFTPADHDFLHQSHVFSNISKILSVSEEVLGDEQQAIYEATHSPEASVVEKLLDLTSDCELQTSSRSAMIGSLTDYSTETFWESGDEDRNKTKTITITWLPVVRPAVIYVHIDNLRDLGNRVTCVIFKLCAGEETILVRQLELDPRFTGWLHMVMEGIARVNGVVLELKGPDPCVRVRQIRVLGGDAGNEGDIHVRGKIITQKNPIVAQYRQCEQETLKVFRLITGQVFGKLIRSSEYQMCSSVEKSLSSVGGEGAVEDVPPTVDVGEDNERNNDLREHVVGILFSRSKLTQLQKLVCAHIVQAIKREGVRARDEWESTLLLSSQMSGASIAYKSPSDESSINILSSISPAVAANHTLPDTYCFEMLSMVLALSGSAVGRTHLAHQDSLLRHLLSLLHTGSARVQRQVTSLFRRMLGDISPRSLASLLGVEKLPDMSFPVLHPPTPSNDGDNEYDMHKQGILDVFLAVIAKALTVQLKHKGTSKENNSKASLSSATLCSSLSVPEKNSPRWWLQGSTTHKLADLIISLIRDMTHGKISESWARVSKGAIAENIINLTKLNETYRDSLQACLATPTLWLALASLCVLHPDHVDTLSSTSSATHSGEKGPQGEVTRPTCDNHDDGETIALVQCDECGELCGECDRVLHLNRKRRLHHRTILRHQQQAIKVDLHEGCGRTKLFWLLALADSTTLKALLELRSESGGTTTNGAAGMRCDTKSECRFCGAPAQTSLLSPTPVCSNQECQDYSREACSAMHPCSHVCGGIRHEKECLPCLHGCQPMPSLRQDADDMCMICFSEALSAAPSIQLECGHIFHSHCCKTVLSKKWPGPRITFTYSLCPICKVGIQHWSLTNQLATIHELYEDVRKKALMRLEYEGLGRSKERAARSDQDLATYAMERYAYYVCYKCNKAYYGGEARCDIEAGPVDDYDPQELVCGGCSDVSRAQMCPKHGTDFLEYKCRYCCSVAVFFCFGTTHFCNACHDDFQRVTSIAKTNLPHCPAGPRGIQLPDTECPLHVQHPETGEEFALGCGVCRNAHTF